MRIVWIVFLMLDVGWAQEPVSEIGIAQYLTMLQEQDISYGRVLQDLDQLEFSKDLNMPSRQFLIDVQNEYGIALNDGPNTSVFGVTGSKLINETGTSAQVFYNRNELIGRDEETIGVRVEQDILRNALGANVRKQSKVQDIENQILYLQVVQAYENYIEDRLQEYLNLQRSYLQLQAAQEIYEYTLRLEKNIEKRNQRSIALQVDVDRIKLQALNAKELLLQTRTVFEQNVQALAKVLGREHIQLDRVQTWSLSNVDEDEDLHEIVSKTRGVEIIKLREKALQDQLLIQKRQLYPELNLVLGFTRDEFTRFNVGADRDEFLIGFGLQVPLGDSLNQARAKSIAFDASVALTDQKLTQRDLEIALARLQQEIDMQQTMVDLSSRKYELSQKILKEEETRYNRGQIDIEWFIDAQTTSAQNQRQSIEEKVQLTSLVVQWLNLTDRLIARVGADIEPSP